MNLALLTRYLLKEQLCRLQSVASRASPRAWAAAPHVSQHLSFKPRCVCDAQQHADKHHDDLDHCYPYFDYVH
jgi:hypothetical protein